MENETQIPALVEHHEILDAQEGTIVHEAIADTPGHDENGDGLEGGQTTADTVGDVLGI